MKLTAVALFKWNGENSDALMLGLAADLSTFGFFQRGTVKEMLVFLCRTVAKRTPTGRRQTVQQDDYFCHVYNRDGLVGMAVVDKDYNSRSAFCVVNKILDDFAAESNDRWRTIQQDSTDAQPTLDAAVVKFQASQAAVATSTNVASTMQELFIRVCSSIVTNRSAYLHASS